MVIAATRLHLRSWFYLAPFLWRTFLTSRQVARAAGFIGGRLLIDKYAAFWTVTGWQNEAVMRAYRDSGAHRAAMPNLRLWCDESTAAHWPGESGTLPAWGEIHRRLVLEGRASPVERPSAKHSFKQFPAPDVGRLPLERKLFPRLK